MPKLPLTVSAKKPDKFLVEIDADRFERLAAGLGLVSDEFRASIKRAEEDIRKGRAQKLHSLRDLR